MPPKLVGSGRRSQAPSGGESVGDEPDRRTDYHRGPRGADLQTPCAGRPGSGGLAVIRTSACLDVVRRRGPWVRALWFAPTCVNLCAPGPRCVPRALGTSSRRRKLEWDCGVPGADQRIRAMTRVRTNLSVTLRRPRSGPRRVCDFEVLRGAPAARTSGRRDSSSRRLSCVSPCPARP